MQNLKINDETLPVLSSLSEIIPGGFFIYHAHGTQELISFNSKMAQLFGCDTDDEFRTLVGNSFKGIVHPDDYEAVETSIRRQIVDSSDRMDHVKYRFIRKDGSVGMMDDYGHFDHSDTLGDIYYVFVQDVSAQYEAELEKQRLARQQRNELIAALTGSVSTYIGYPDTDRFTILAQNEHLKVNYAADETFTDSITRYIENDVYAPDRSRAAQEISLSKIASYLQTATEFTFRFRDISSGVPRWYEMKAARLSSTEVLYSFSDIDDALTAEIVYEKLKDNYFGLYCIDLGTGHAKVIRTGHPELTGEVGTVRNYTELIRDIAAASKDDAMDFMHRISSTDYLKERFQTDDLAYFYYQSHLFEGKRWISVTGNVLKRKADGTPELLGLGFSLMDEASSKVESSKARALQEHARVDLQMISGLAGEYYALYYYNIREKLFHIYTLDQQRFPQAAGMVTAGGEPIDVLRRFGTSPLVHPDDRAQFAVVDDAYLQEKLAHSKKHSVPFRRVFNGEYQWAEMDIIKSEDYDEPANAIVIGFAERDLAIRSQKALSNAYEVLNKEYGPDEAIDKLVAIAGEFYRADRCYIIEDRKSTKTIDNTYEWCAPGIEPEIDKLQDVPAEVCAGWYEEFRRQGAFFMDALDSEHNTPETVEILQMQGIESLVVAPILADNEIIGYIGVDNPKKAERDVAVLQGIANVAYSQILERNRRNSVAEKMLREQMAQKEQLAEALSMAESANRAKTIFLNNMSHDIRTPMNAIIGYTGLAASHIDNKAQVQDYLAKIAQSSDHLLSLINDVLDMSRIESGKINLEEKAENLPEIIHTLRDIVQADIHSKHHDFFIDTVNVNDENILCDKLRLNQVLLNILSNSIKYTAAGGILSMRITEKTVKANGYATYEFLIKDNGMGMDSEFVKTIFDPFTRMKSSTVSGIQGTGLGMAITKNIIDMMGGRIDIQSEPGKGTETTVTFDFKLAEAHKDNFEIPELRGLRALIADDDANTCVSIERMLREIGMRSEWCTSGKEAVFRAESAYSFGDRFKVYIIDWLMPDMNGIETTRRIRKAIGDDVPIIILTAYDWSDIEDEAREAGVTAFVSKPMFMSDLSKVLSSCIGRTAEPATADSPVYDFSGKKILLVEDNELNSEIAVAILEEDGFIIDTADDGTVAVEKIKAASPGDYDLVLMDIQMPVMDGYEATRQIRALGTEPSRIPIIAMTANAFEDDRIAALEAGMNAHLPKPIDVDKLKALLAQYLQ